MVYPYGILRRRNKKKKKTKKKLINKKGTKMTYTKIYKLHNVESMYTDRRKQNRYLTDIRI